MTTPARGINPEVSIEQLADGFAALRDEYKRLAQQYHEVEQKLLTAKKEYDVLRRLLTENLPDQTLPLELDIDSTNPEPTRNLGEWLELTLKDDSNKQATLDKIKQAEVSLFRTRGWLVRRMTRDSYLAQDYGSTKTGNVPPKIKAHHTLNMEQDFTTPGTPGNLGCPFTAAASARHRRSTEQKHSLPTPRSSGSNFIPHDQRSKQPSIDPITRGIHRGNGTSVVSSEDEDAGPMCPIRFMSDHPPEDIAKYFEEHKHELPKSHQLCVKRFQDNAQGIKQLDEKYGNLVSMIQGLGEKHVPMLPEEPNPDANEIEHDETKSTRRVKKWAKGVNEDASDEAHPQDVPNETNGEAKQGTTNNKNGIPPSDNAEDEEERLQYFDRPLKEIRVGESPTRPWGVPIPSRYLDRNVADEPTSPAAEPAANSKSNPDDKSNAASNGSAAAATPKPDAPVPPQHQHQQQQEQESQQHNPQAASGAVVARKGKCPVQPKIKLPSKMTSFLDQLAKDATPAREPGEAPPDKADGDEHGKGPKKEVPSITNHGVAVMSSKEAVSVTNYGTLIYGFDDDEERRKLFAEALAAGVKGVGK